MPSLHDNIILSYEVDLENERIRMRTRSSHDVPKNIDVLFSGVMAHAFDTPLHGSIMLDLDEWNIEHFIPYNRGEIQVHGDLILLWIEWLGFGEERRDFCSRNGVNGLRREYTQHGSKRGAGLRTGIVVLVVLFVILLMTNPNEEDFVAWLASEHDIHSSYDVDEGRTFTQTINGEEKKLHYTGGHIQHMGIFSTYSYLFSDNEEKEIQIEAVGIMNMLFNR